MSHPEPDQVTVEIERRRPQAEAVRELGDGPALKSMLSTAELSRRPSRPTDHAAESRALIALARTMAATPNRILQALAETALSLCSAHSAGLSLLENDDRRTRFHWRAIAGQWSPHLHGGTPRDFGPCGTVLDRNMAMLCSHPERDFPYFAPVTPLLEEALLSPFYVNDEAVGTIWVVAHDTSRRFDAEDLRMLTSLGAFAAAAYQTVQTMNALQRTASVVADSHDAVVGKDLSGIIRSWNRGAKRLFGYSADEVIGKSITILIPPERQNEETEIIQRIGRGECIEHYETVRRRKDGSLIDISLTISPVKDVDGTIVGASKIARDITERKLAAKQIALLAAEVDHRAKNLLALAQAVVQLTQADTVAGFKEAVEGRIQALARAHTLLARGRWAGADLKQLAAEQFAPYCRDGEQRARVDGPALMLEPNTAQSIAIVLHELTTNAVKYGALSSADGAVAAEWKRTADGPLVLRWTETGGPPVTPPARQGFGTKVIEQTVRGQLKGDTRFDWRREGLLCEITMPMPSDPA
ncbi:MAG: PAS domain S-box protein [Xanthobacteraceae bacterium]